jgi:dTMP kinase
VKYGKFITVDRIEGGGKSTNIDYLSGLLEKQGIELVRTREPGGTPMAERIRGLLLEHGEEPLPDIAELLLFFAARSLHVTNTIRPALRAGKWVVCDRFTDATRAYQGDARGLDMERINTLAMWVQDGLEPDVTFLLDAPANIGMERAEKRGAVDRMESEQISFFDRAREGYLKLARAEPERFAVIDASQSLAAVKVDIEQKIRQLLTDYSH